MRRSVRLPPEQLKPYTIDPPCAWERLEFSAIFENNNPVELEIGFGKGLFLLTASEAHPDINYLGIEIEKKYYYFTANRIAKRNRENVRLVCADAKVFLPNHIADQSVQAVHVYFPDPWWKKRHRKRRLFTPSFAEQCGRVIKPGGWLHVVSDVKEYFELITGIVADPACFEEQMIEPRGEPSHDFDYLTNFDRKYRKEGRPIYRARYRRSSTHNGD